MTPYYMHCSTLYPFDNLPVSPYRTSSHPPYNFIPCTLYMPLLPVLTVLTLPDFVPGSLTPL